MSGGQFLGGRVRKSGEVFRRPPKIRTEKKEGSWWHIGRSSASQEKYRAEGGRGTADREKFLLRFSNTHNKLPYVNSSKTFTPLGNYQSNGKYPRLSQFLKKAAKQKLKTTDLLLIFVALQKSLRSSFWNRSNILKTKINWTLLVKGNTVSKKTKAQLRLVLFYNQS